MKRTLSRACKMYNLLPSITQKISESTLRKYKPRYVKLQGKLPFRQSCCEVCQNFEFVVNNALQFLNGIPKTIDNCVDSSMCEYNTYFPKLDCVIRECSSCGTDTLKLKLERLNADYLNDTRKRFLVKQWYNKKERIAGSDKYRTYIHWKHERLSYSDLLDKYIDLLVKMSSHSFFAAWNFHQYLVCKNNLEKGQIIMAHVNVCDVVCLCPGCLHGDSECKNLNYADKWRGFDMKEYVDIEPDFRHWKSVQIHKTVGSRDDYSWDGVLAIIGEKNSFDEVAEYVRKNPLPFFDFHINDILTEQDRDYFDLVALHYKPADAPEGYVPCEVGSDGNCFPRALSFICFRNQDSHTEMHVRLIYESILNAKYYISNRYKSRGCNIVYITGGPVKHLAMYADSYNPAEQFDVVSLQKGGHGLNSNRFILWSLASLSSCKYFT